LQAESRCSLGKQGLALSSTLKTLIAVIIAASAAFGCVDTASAGAKSKERVRKELARQLSKNPKVAVTRSFMHKAQLVDFKLPLTVRLARSNGAGGYEASDDQLQIAWDDSAVPWPLAGGVPAGPQTTFLSGKYTMEADFGGDASGTGELGAFETVQGNAIAMNAQPFTISDFDSTCLTPPGPQLSVLPAVDPTKSVEIVGAGARYGLMNIFSGRIRGTLAMRMKLRSTGLDCPGAGFTGPLYDVPADPPIPVRYDGTFRMSPAITPDGKVRFGRMTIDDTVTAQTSTFGYVGAHTTTDTSAPMRFPARIKLLKMTAEVLLGDIGPF
jgi:hypothetical protein